MAAPSLRAKTAVSGGSGTSLGFTVPAGTQAGDALYIWAVVEGTVTIALPTGGQTWTQVSQTQVGGGTPRAVACFELPNWNGTDTAYTVGWGGSSKYRSGIIESFQGADKAAPRNAQSGAAWKENTPASTNAVVDGLTTTVNECLLVSCILNWNGAGATAAGGWTEDADNLDLQVARINAAVNAGVQSSVTHTYGSAQVSHTLMIALQPSQIVAEPRRLTLLGVGR